MKPILTLLFSFISIAAFSQTSTINDEAAFRRVLASFKVAVARRDFTKVTGMLYFPFYTARTDMGNENYAPADGIRRTEFKSFEEAIFNKEVIQLIPKIKENNLTEIDKIDDGQYYSVLRKFTDKGSRLYEAYLQYPEQHTNAETYFGFVFGRIRGSYKVIAYYGKWPVK